MDLKFKGWDHLFTLDINSITEKFSSFRNS